MIPLLAIAMADPVALRVPGQDAVTVAVGGPDVGAAVDLGPVSIGAHTRTDLGSIEVTAGFGGRVLGEGVWGLDLLGGVGLVTPLASPSLGISGFGAVSTSARGERVRGSLTLALPFATSVQPAARLGVVPETWLAVKAGPVWVGGRAALGFVVATEASWAISPEAQLVVSVPSR